MDLLVLQEICFELNRLLAGAFINRIYQPLPREIVLRIRTRGGTESRLMTSADPRWGRVHLTQLKIPNPPRPPRFCAYLRAHFQSAVITEVSCAADDRVVSIRTVRGPRDGGSRMALVLELLGRDSNLLLVDLESNLIMECLHRIPEKEAGTRVVLPGRAYLPPPKREGSAPLPVVPSGPSTKSPGIRTGTDGQQRLTVSAVLPQDEPYPSMNEAADAFYSPRLRAMLVEGLRRQLAAPLKSRIGSLERRLGKIEADRQRLTSLAARQEEGELLKANLARVKKGMEQIQVRDWTTGRHRMIRLEPSLDAVRNMEKIFKASAKGKRGKDRVEKRLKETTEELSALKDLLFFIEDAQDVEELNRLAPDLPAVLSPGISPESEKTRGRHSTALWFRTCGSPSGRVVLVGKSARGNDFLLREKARKGDLWFHVKGAAGAHVLIPVRGKDEPTLEDIGFAAALAVHFSKARGKGKVEVIFADAGELSRPRGALPGQVTVKRHATLVSEGLRPGQAAAINGLDDS